MNTDTARTEFSAFLDQLRTAPRTWLVTGAAGFIGSHLVETLLSAGQTVRGLDNLSTGSMRNVEAVRPAELERYTFIEGDIRDVATCVEACAGVDVVLHQAALGSVPRSIADPQATHASNVNGTLNMLVAARDGNVSRFVFASSSSVYGDHPGLPKVEDEIGTPLSPYAVSKRTGELYAGTFFDHYGLETIGLRYFNVFGPRQDPAGPYAAVLPKWVDTLLSGERCIVNGDGETSRDFCYVRNVAQANLRAALAPAGAAGRVYNVAVGDRTTLNELFRTMADGLKARGVVDAAPVPEYSDFRAGDVRHSLADVSSAREALNYRPTHPTDAGLQQTVAWYVRHHVEQSAAPSLSSAIAQPAVDS